MLLASFSNFMGQPLPLVIFELIGAGFAAYGLIAYIKNLNVKQQLQAKDAIIETNRQTIEAFEERLNSLDKKVAALEQDLSDATNKNQRLTSELRDWESRYRDLENFAAPALGQKLVEMFSHQEKVLDKVVVVLQGIESRMDTLEGKNK